MTQILISPIQHTQIRSLSVVWCGVVWCGVRVCVCVCVCVCGVVWIVCM